MRRLRSGTLRWMGIVLAVAMVIAGNATARGDGITSIVSFGDSLSDVGNFYAQTGGAVPPTSYGYDAGRFTNGPNWVEYLAKDLGIAAPTSSSSGGTDYAYGGATSGSGTTQATFLGATVTVPNVGTQIDTYLASNTPSASQLFTIWAGANDFLNAGVTNPQQVAQNITNDITALAEKGAIQFLIPNLPPLGALPSTEGKAPPQALDALSAGFNASLQADVAQLENNDPKLQIHLLDVNTLFNNVLSDPAQYGLTSTGAAPIGSNGSGYLFWIDGTHPTTQVDAILGEVAAQSVPEPSSLAIFGSAAAVLAVWRLGRQRARRRARADAGGNMVAMS